MTAPNYDVRRAPPLSSRKGLTGRGREPAPFCVSMEDIDNIAPDKLKELRDCFATFDNDNSGSITAIEFQCALIKMNLYIPDDEVRQLINEYDTDGDSTLDFQEFIHLVSKLDPRVGQDIDINKAFKLYDKNQDGFITRKELMDALARFGIHSTEDDIEMLFSMTDDNNDGLITHTEFRNMIFDAPATPSIMPPSSSKRVGSRSPSPRRRG